jgi:hypothetical protein
MESDGESQEMPKRGEFLGESLNLAWILLKPNPRPRIWSGEARVSLWGALECLERA